MNKKDIDFIFFSGDNGYDFPKGGITSFSRQMMHVFGNRMALVGISTDNTPVGKWVQKEFDGKTYLFFSIARLDKNKIKPIVPQRLSSYFRLKKYKKQILELDVKKAFIQNSHFLLAIKGWDLSNKAYIFHGATNPLEKPRYLFAKWLAPFYETIMFERLKSYNTIFAAADDNDINKLVRRSGNRINKKIIKLPTRFDNKIFFPADKKDSVKALNLEEDKLIFVQVGRISKQKGCDFILESFGHFLKHHTAAVLYFVGDGEEKGHIQEKINSMKLSKSVKITGFVTTEMVALYYNAADVVLVGSHMEGWSIAMVEALACGKNIVAPNVSGAKDMISEGENGFIVESRNPELFAKKMAEAVKLPVPNKCSINKSSAYSLSTLRRDIEKHWP